MNGYKWATRLRALMVFLVLVGLSFGLLGAAPQASMARRNGLFTITARVFIDKIGPRAPGAECPGCNGVFDPGDWAANMAYRLPPVKIIVRDGETGEIIARQHTHQRIGDGLHVAIFVLPTHPSFEVEIAQIPPADFELCPNSPRSRRFRTADYSMRQATISFALRLLCPIEQDP